MFERYRLKLDEVFTKMIKKYIFNGFMYGLSSMLFQSTLGLAFFFSVLFTSKNPEIGTANSLSALILIFFACNSVGIKSNMIQDLTKINDSISWIFARLKKEDEH